VTHDSKPSNLGAIATMIMIEGHDEISAQMELKSGSLVWAFALQGERAAYQRLSY
jgi:hypothetical protein